MTKYNNYILFYQWYQNSIQTKNYQKTTNFFHDFNLYIIKINNNKTYYKI